MQLLQENETRSSRVCEWIRSLESGTRFTSSDIVQELGQKEIGSIVGFLNRARSSYPDFIKAVGKIRHAIVYEVVDPSTPIRFNMNKGPGGKPGRKMDRRKGLNADLQRLSPGMFEPLVPSPHQLVELPQEDAPSTPLLRGQAFSERLLALAIEAEGMRTSLEEFTTEELLAELNRRSVQGRI